ncbi:MAG: RHS repeat-associated core domain-containing protein, partial [Candidatus Nealsonbacteria bacterium]|nr:RHS repeat-associated core domain-containing protein [Candidatus Nealsonbacteria bacterium]
YHYDPYGKVTVLNGAEDADESVSEWSVDADNQSDYHNPYLYTGRRLDEETGLQYSRARYYNTTLGRFINRDPGGYPMGDMNLYGYVGGRPTTHVDPMGLKEIGGGAYGDWEITQTNLDYIAPLVFAGRPERWFKSEVDIYFSPNPRTICCDEIAFMQAVQIWNNAEHAVHNWTYNRTEQPRYTSTGWHIDASSGDVVPWYGYDENGPENADPAHPNWIAFPWRSADPLEHAGLHDNPRGLKVDLNTTWSFESVAICKRGDDQGKVYGAIYWGFDVDADGKVTSHANYTAEVNSYEFEYAMNMWNEQALGPEEQRTHPNQAPLDIDFWGQIEAGGCCRPNP